jgi:hypothetical protein
LFKIFQEDYLKIASQNLDLLRLSNRLIASGSCTVKESGFGVIVIDGIVHGTTIIPHQYVTFSPAVTVDIFLSNGLLCEPVDQ